jgi:quinol-cytochrome oxidoreductase complex cytochrome b subunit
MQLPSDTREHPGAARDDLARARFILLGILSVAVGVVSVTGIALFFLYRPTTQQAWPGLLTESYQWDVRVSSALRLIHRLAAWLAVFTAVATGVALAIRRPATASRWTGPVLGAGLAIATLAAFFTGLLLPWDQLALSAVTVGSNIRGYRVLFDPVVRFVLIGGVEISRHTLVGWLLVHMALLGPALVTLVVLGWRRKRGDVAAGP